MTAYPPGLDAHDRAAWDLRMASHSFCTWIYTWSRELQATVKRCSCGAEEVARSVAACRVRVTATVVAEAAQARRRALLAHPLALPAAPSALAWPAQPTVAAQPLRPIHLTAATGESA